MKRKGQAALEFLITYSWAIVIIVGIVASLFFMGIQNPERYVTSRCLFEDSFECNDFSFTAGDSGSGYVTIELENLVGFPIQIDDIETIVDGDTNCDFSGVSPSLPFSINDSESRFIEIYCSVSTDLAQSATIALEMDVEYRIINSDGSIKQGYFPKTASGKIVGRS